MKIRQKEHNAIHVSLYSNKKKKLRYTLLKKFYARGFGGDYEFFNQAEERTWI